MLVGPSYGPNASPLLSSSLFNRIYDASKDFIEFEEKTPHEWQKPWIASLINRFLRLWLWISWNMWFLTYGNVLWCPKWSIWLKVFFFAFSFFLKRRLFASSPRDRGPFEGRFCIWCPRKLISSLSRRGSHLSLSGCSSSVFLWSTGTKNVLLILVLS